MGFVSMREDHQKALDTFYSGHYARNRWTDAGGPRTAEDTGHGSTALRVLEDLRTHFDRRCDEIEDFLTDPDLEPQASLLLKIEEKRELQRELNLVRAELHALATRGSGPE